LAVTLLIGLTGADARVPKPVMQSTDPTLVWAKPAEVKRQPKPYQPKPAKPRPRIQKVPLLALRMWVLKRDQSLNPVETSPNAIFHLDDRLQIALEVNQDGYLYLVQEKTNADDVIFPDSRINDGQNYVKKGQKIIIPSNCLAEYNDERGRCWWKINEEDDELTVVFSRTMLLDMPAKLTATAKNVSVEKKTIAALKQDAGNDIQQVSLGDRYTIQFSNNNNNNNEILIAKISLKHD
jgi:hypothetical protein